MKIIKVLYLIKEILKIRLRSVQYSIHWVNMAENKTKKNFALEWVSKISKNRTSIRHANIRCCEDNESGISRRWWELYIDNEFELLGKHIQILMVNMVWKISSVLGSLKNSLNIPVSLLLFSKGIARGTCTVIH